MLDADDIKIEEIPGALRSMADAVERRMHGYDSTLRQAVQDFGRGTVTLPELMKLAEEDPK